MLIDQPADCPEAVKPATVRLVLIHRIGWMGVLDKWLHWMDGSSKWLIDQSVDCPEAEARHGQTDCGCSKWLIHWSGG